MKEFEVCDEICVHADVIEDAVVLDETLNGGSDDEEEEE